MDFLIPEIDKDRDEAVKANKALKKRPAGAPTIDKEEQFWKGEFESASKEVSLKPTKNSRD